jgi:hypothetical protein
MNNSLIQYFIKFGHLVLPEIGILKWHKQEAFWENNTLIAPKEQIILESVNEKPSKQFYAFIADELGISVEQANLQFETYINQFTSQNIGSLNIGNLGTLHKNVSQYAWNNLYQGDQYFKNITPIVAAVDIDEKINVANRNYSAWMYWAIAITIVAVSLILLKKINIR